MAKHPCIGFCANVFSRLVKPSHAPRPRSWSAALVAVLVGCAGAAIIWLVTPYNNFVLANCYISDSYLPAAALFLMLILTLLVNPLLRAIRPRWALSNWQLAIAFGIMLVASVLPGQGLLRLLPYSIAKVPLEAGRDAQLAGELAKMRLPANLFPGPTQFAAPSPACEQFIQELPPGETIPWAAWAGPLLTWSAFLLPGWMMMLGLGLIMYPHWRRNERLSFPLLSVEQALTESPAPGHLFPAALRERAFWIAAGVVFLLHFLAGMKVYYPEAIPAVPLRWDASSLFSEEPWRHLPEHIRITQAYFVFLGIAFFMPDRISFSIWFFVVAYGLSQMIGTAYAPPYPSGASLDHRWGAMLVLTAGILWTSRRHWARVLAGLPRRAKDEEGRRDRKAGRLFLAGCAGMFAWLVWAGVGPGWALLFVAFAFMVSLLVARVVAETGVPFFRIDTRFQVGLMKLAPLSWIQAQALYFSFVVAMLFETASRVNLTVMSTHALGLDEEAPPRKQWRMTLFFLPLLACGLIVCGAAHLSANYHHSASLDGKELPLNVFGVNQLDRANRAVVELSSGQLSRPPHNQAAHLLFGAGLAGALQWACLATPRWPLHPVGLLMVGTFYGGVAWASILLGWLIKTTLVRYGGARLYRTAKPFFLGLILGEVFAAVFWALVPVALVMLDQPYRVVYVLPPQ